MSDQYLELFARIGNRLRRLRLDNNVTQKTVEAATGLNHGTVSRIENGRYRGLTILKLEKLTDYYGVDIGRILEGEPAASH